MNIETTGDVKKKKNSEQKKLLYKGSQNRFPSEQEGCGSKRAVRFVGGHHRPEIASRLPAGTLE